MNRVKQIVTLLLVVAMATISFGCTATTAPEQESTSTAGTATEATAPAEETEKPVLRIFDYFAEENTAVALLALADRFAEQTGCTIERETMSYNEYNDIIQTNISLEGCADIITTLSGSGYVGELAAAGLLVDLTDAKTQYGWGDYIADWTMSVCSYDGSPYAVGNELECLGVFYNKAIFQAAGVEVPKTYDEFVTVCQTLKDAGYMPIGMGDSEQWPGYHLESVLMNAAVGADAMTDILNLKASFDQEALANGLDLARSWVVNGYLSENVNGIAYEDNASDFMAGRVAMDITGTWQVEEYVNALGDDCGFFFFPMIDSSLASSAPAGVGSAIAVAKNGENTELALEFLNFIFLPENADIWYSNGIIPPCAVDDSTLASYNLPALFSDVVSVCTNTAGMGWNLDVILPSSVNNHTANYMQELLAGTKTGAECVAEKESALEESVANGEYSGMSD